MGAKRIPGEVLSSIGRRVLRAALATNLLWIGGLKFTQYEVDLTEPLVTTSPLFSWTRRKLGAQTLARLIGVTEIALGSLIAAKPLAPRASAAGSLGTVGMFLTTLSFLATMPGVRPEGESRLTLSQPGQFLLKDSVLLGAAFLTAADALSADGHCHHTAGDRTGGAPNPPSG